MKIEIQNIGKIQDKFLNSCNPPIWLTEENLFDKLSILFPEETILKGVKIEKYTPDYILEDQNAIVEFDGPRHFSSSEQCYKDEERDEFFIKEGYEVIRIPYFVQLTPKLIEYLFFNLQNPDIFKINLSNEFPHGFVHPKCLLPGDFCYPGLIKYKRILSYFPEEVEFGCDLSLKARSLYKKVPEYFTNPNLEDEKYLKLFKFFSFRMKDPESRFFKDFIMEHNDLLLDDNGYLIMGTTSPVLYMAPYKFSFSNKSKFDDNIGIELREWSENIHCETYGCIDVMTQFIVTNERIGEFSDFLERKQEKFTIWAFDNSGESKEITLISKME